MTLEQLGIVFDVAPGVVRALVSWAVLVVFLGDLLALVTYGLLRRLLAPRASRRTCCAASHPAQ